MSKQVLPTSLARRLGSTIEEVADLTQPWSTRTRTLLVSIDRGDPVVLQWTSDRTSLALRLRIGRQLLDLAPWLPVPEVLAGDAGGPFPFIVSRYVAGHPGSALLADDDEATLLGSAIGAMLGELSRVPMPVLRLSATWSDATALDLVAHRWIAGAGGALGETLEASLGQLLPQLPAVFAGVRPVFAHGDLVPVNVVLRDETVVAVLDLERARIAHPLFDAAWFRLIVRVHHPDRWKLVGPAFMTAARIPPTQDVTTSLDVLAALQCLEMVHRSRSRTVRSDWVSRLSEVISWTSTAAQA